MIVPRVLVAPPTDATEWGGEIVKPFDGVAHLADPRPIVATSGETRPRGTSASTNQLSSGKSGVRFFNYLTPEPLLGEGANQEERIVRELLYSFD